MPIRARRELTPAANASAEFAMIEMTPGLAQAIADCPNCQAGGTDAPSAAPSTSAGQRTSARSVQCSAADTELTPGRRGDDGKRRRRGLRLQRTTASVGVGFCPSPGTCISRIPCDCHMNPSRVMASSSRGGVSYPQSKVIPWGIVAKMWGFVTNVELYRGELSPTTIREQLSSSIAG